ASLLGAMLLAHPARLAVFHETGESPGRWGSGHPEIVPYRAYRAADGWVFVAGWVDRLWRPFCEAPGRPGRAADPLFPGRADRIANRGGLDAIIEKVFAQRTVAEWIETLERADV